MIYIIPLLFSLLVLFVGIWLAFVSKERESFLKRAIRFNFKPVDEVKKRRFNIPYITDLEKKAKQAGISLGAFELRILVILLLAAGWGFGMFLFGQIVISVILAPLGPIFFFLAIKKRIEKRSDAFRPQLEVTARLLANSLQAGLSIQQAIFRAADKVPTPMSDELQRVKKEINAGTSVAAADRIPVPEFQMVVLAIKIHSSIGGDLPRVLINVADTISEQQSLHQTMKTYVAEGRFAANIVGAVPIVAVVLMRLTAPDYFAPMTESFIGKTIIIACVASIIVGWSIVRRMSEFR